MSDGSAEPSVPVTAATAIDAATIVAEPADAAGTGAVALDVIDDADSAAAALTAAETQLSAVVAAGRKKQSASAIAVGDLRKLSRDQPTNTEARAAADNALEAHELMCATLGQRYSAACEAVATARTRCERFAKSLPAVAPTQRPATAAKTQRKTIIGVALPEHAEALLQLPYGAGLAQAWILGRAKYPSPSTAGITALAVLSFFAMGHITVNCFGGLALHEFIMILAPTGFGKDDYRACIATLDKHVRSTVIEGANLRSQRLPGLQWSAPASLQGIHHLLQAHRLQLFASDEFGEWLAQAGSDSHRQQALGYFMQLYSSHHGTVTAPHAVTREYSPVEKPRVSIFATSTSERMLAAMTSGQAESGAFNRFVILVAEQERIAKKYEGFEYDAPTELLALIDWIMALPPTVLEFAPGAWQFFMQHDSEVIEPLRFTDNILAARLSEQAIKIAALIALSDRRTAITANDLGTAYAIRESVYRRAATLIGTEGAISGMHATGKALQQLTGVFAKHQTLRRAWLPNYSRAYKALTTAERNSVLNALLADGTVFDRPDAPGMLFAGEVDDV